MDWSRDCGELELLFPANLRITLGERIVGSVAFVLTKSQPLESALAGEAIPWLLLL